MTRLITEQELPPEIEKYIETIVGILLDKFLKDIHKIILFGSYATGKYQPDSDTDVAVVLNQLPNPKSRRLYKQAIDIDKEVDLLVCTKEQLSSDSFVYKHINEQEVVLYEQL